MSIDTNHNVTISISVIVISIHKGFTFSVAIPYTTTIEILPSLTLTRANLFTTVGRSREDYTYNFLLISPLVHICMIHPQQTVKKHSAAPKM